MPLLMPKCCGACCTDLDLRPTADFATGDWIGATFSNVDEWPADDSTTEMVTTLVAPPFPGRADSGIAMFAGPPYASVGGLPQIRIRSKLVVIEPEEATVIENAVGVSVFIGGLLKFSWSMRPTSVWQQSQGIFTYLNGAEGPIEFHVQASLRVGVGATYEYHVSAFNLIELCP